MLFVLLFHCPFSPLKCKLHKDSNSRLYFQAHRTETGIKYMFNKYFMNEKKVKRYDAVPETLRIQSYTNLGVAMDSKCTNHLLFSSNTKAHGHEMALCDQYINYF